MGITPLTAEAVQGSNIERQIGGSQPPILSNQLDRVLEKEEASSRAVCNLERIARKIRESPDASSNQNLTDWRALITSLQRENNRFQYVVGVAGDTGTGKSSLLNALLSEAADVAPSSQHGACTAAVCCFLSRSPDDDVDTKFFAKVHLKSKDTVNQELASFFAELNDFEIRLATDGENDSLTFSEQEKLNDQLSVIHGWSGISKERLKEFGRENNTDEITCRCQKSNELFHGENPRRRKIIPIAEDNSNDFLKALKRYVGSTGRSSQALRWPLVAKVEIFVDSELLKDGIILVDLPGETDALDSRSQVAREFYNSLDSQMIVTPGDRAFDNKTAIELLRDDQIMDMEADGLIRDNGICVVVTKADLMDWRNFSGTEVEPASISDDFENLHMRLSELEIAKVQAEEGSGNQAVGCASDDLAHLVQNPDELAREMSRLEALCLRRCIEYRNKDTQKSFEKYFDRIRNSGRAKSAARLSTNLQVFSVSSKAHRALARGRPEPAFHSAQSTGIDALKAWIINASLQKREDHADEILHRCQVLFDAIYSWGSGDIFTGIRLPEDTQARFKHLISKKQEFLHGQLALDIKNFCNRVERLLAKVVLHCPIKNSGAEIRFVKHVESFAMATAKVKMHWATYAACIRRRGGAFQTSVKPRKTYNWQARTYGLFWSPYALSWGQLYGPELLKKTVDFDGRLASFMVRFMQDLALDENLPEEFQIVLRSCAYRIENIFAELRIKMKKSVAEHRQQARIIKQQSRDLIALKMQGAYDTANEVSGKGKKERQEKVMAEQAAMIKERLFLDVGIEIDKELKQERGIFKGSLKRMGTKAVVDIDKIINRLCHDLCSPDKQPTKKKIAEPSKLQQAVLAETNAWRQFWDELRMRLPPMVLKPYEEDEPSSDAENDEEAEGCIKKEGRKDEAVAKAEPGKKQAGKKRATKGDTAAGPRKAAKNNKADGRPRAPKARTAAKSGDEIPRGSAHSAALPESPAMADSQMNEVAMVDADAVNDKGKGRPAARDVINIDE
ncbi:hypothetical protein HIM_03533 [Hirsutella minnesotensis 3608]|uniref:Uncharacterized protein n=1 Tax=Hirsutella minnesotensis 3608 TaxID=1043627 RepID=A0A0F8A2R9_9HYPO|nr:hypothetical protein HIM_03533 [Hirsutella minnesotensis 3608]